MATAIGRPLNIPILIRSLGHGLYTAGLDPAESFVVGPALKTYIDGKLSCYGPDDPNLQVTTFHVSWWTGTDTPVLDTSYLTSHTIQSALRVHRTSLQQIRARKQSDHSGAKKPFYSWHREVWTADAPTCVRCRLYRAVSFGTLDSLRDVWNMVQGCEAAAESERAVASRRSSGFNQLYEAVIAKECQTDQSDSDSADSDSSDRDGSGYISSQRQMSTLIPSATHQIQGNESQIDWTLNTAIEDLIRKSGPIPDSNLATFRAELSTLVSNLVGASKKWTWGVDLTSIDLQEMAQACDRIHRPSFPISDSDCNSGITQNSISRSASLINSTDGWFDDMGSDVASVRSLEPQEFPLAFSLPPLHHLCFVDTESESSPVIRAFGQHAEETKKAAREARKKVMQAEIYLPDSYVEGEPDILLPVQPFPFASSAVRADCSRLPRLMSAANIPINYSVTEPDLPPIPLGILGQSDVSRLPTMCSATNFPMDHTGSEVNLPPIPLGMLGERIMLPPIPLGTLGQPSSSHQVVNVLDPEPDHMYLVPFVPPVEPDSTNTVGHAESAFRRDPVSGLYTPASFYHLPSHLFE